MRVKILILLLVISTSASAQFNYQEFCKKTFKFSTFYTSVNGGTSLSNEDVFSVTTGVLKQDVVKTPYDYNISLGLRKIARFGYENKAQTFYDGTEKSWSDGASIGKVSGLEFLFEANYKRQQALEYLDQHHFIRFVKNTYIIKGEYLEDGFADIKYFETSERYRYKVNRKLSFNAGLAQRLSEPYGYDPLEEWLLSTGNLHYTHLAIKEGYTVDVYANEYKNPSGTIVATSKEVWEEVVIPQVLSDYSERKRNELANTIQHSVVLGFDFYHYDKNFWAHSWGNVMPYHLNDNNEFSYHTYNDGQWLDYSGGLIFGYKYSKNLGAFIEGKYNKYWNREWYDFKFGINYIIF
tara:strand:- start:820 stop:1872 length:1053 start_codon:yes stop_codon:yes gene_type:complete